MRFRNFNFDFIGKRKIWFIVSLAVVIIGITGFFIRSGFNLGIDFLGGSLIEVEFEKEVNVAEVREVMNDLDYGSTILQMVKTKPVQTESNRFIIRTTPISTEEKRKASFR